MKPGTILRQWSDELETPVETLEKEFEGYTEKVKAKHPKASETKITEKAIWMMSRKIAAEKRLVDVEGYVIGKSAPFDSVKAQRDKAIEAYQEDKPTAIASGLTDEEGIPLWTADTFKTMEPDDNRIGKKLPDHLYLQSVFGINKKTNNIFRLSLSRDQIKEAEDISRGDILSLKVIDRGKQSYLENYSLSRYSKINVKTPDNIDKVLKEIVKRLDEMENTLIQPDTLRNYVKQIVLTSGGVDWINPEVTEQGSWRLGLSGLNTDRAVTCWVPESIAADFGRGSTIYTLGTVREGRPYGDTQETPIQLNVYALVVDPEMRESVESSFSIFEG